MNAISTDFCFLLPFAPQSNCGNTQFFVHLNVGYSVVHRRWSTIVQIAYQFSSFYFSVLRNRNQFTIAKTHSHVWAQPIHIRQSCVSLFLSLSRSVSAHTRTQTPIDGVHRMQLLSISHWMTTMMITKIKRKNFYFPHYSLHKCTSKTTANLYQFFCCCRHLLQLILVWKSNCVRIPCSDNNCSCSHYTSLRMTETSLWRTFRV